MDHTSAPAPPALPSRASKMMSPSKPPPSMPPLPPAPPSLNNRQLPRPPTTTTTADEAPPPRLPQKVISSSERLHASSANGSISRKLPKAPAEYNINGKQQEAAAAAGSLRGAVTNSPFKINNQQHRWRSPSPRNGTSDVTGTNSGRAREMYSNTHFVEPNSAAAVEDGESSSSSSNSEVVSYNGDEHDNEVNYVVQTDVRHTSSASKKVTTLILGGSTVGESNDDDDDDAL